MPYLQNLRALARRDPALPAVLLALRPSESRLVQLRQQPVLLSVTAFTDEGGRTLLVAFQPLREAVQETEAQAYQKLLRVLAHELMNSVVPIASLADTLLQQLAAPPPCRPLCRPTWPRAWSSSASAARGCCTSPTPTVT